VTRAEPPRAQTAPIRASHLITPCIRECAGGILRASMSLMAGANPGWALRSQGVIRLRFFLRSVSGIKPPVEVIREDFCSFRIRSGGRIAWRQK
jgi:hypothetical protein